MPILHDVQRASFENAKATRISKAHELKDSDACRSDSRTPSGRRSCGVLPRCSPNQWRCQDNCGDFTGTQNTGFSQADRSLDERKRWIRGGAVLL